jgi:hypothetical protein
MADLRLLPPNLCEKIIFFTYFPRLYGSLKPDIFHLNFIVNVDIVLGLLNGIAWAVFQKQAQH